MNNTQLYVTVGLPITVFLLTWLANRAEMNRHIDRIDRRIEVLSAEMSAMRADHHKDNLALMGYMVAAA